ncbi:MAG TPA: YraN family protein [Clostridiaceae bacterium]|nr:YraN family protein [Clostridiaceae bacterium]
MNKNISDGNTPEKSLSNKRTIGSICEKHAIDFLSKNGYEILKCNFRFGRLGEVDIIAREGGYLCFIEVKSRSSVFYGTPAESVSQKKQSYIRKLAGIYLKRYNKPDTNVRFDVVEVIFRKERNNIAIRDINLIKNAF